MNTVQLLNMPIKKAISLQNADEGLGKLFFTCFHPCSTPVRAINALGRILNKDPQVGCQFW